MATCRKGVGWGGVIDHSFPSCCRLASNRPEVVTGPKGNPGLISRQSTPRSPITYISSVRPASCAESGSGSKDSSPLLSSWFYCSKCV
jgi:hypothetical protein